MNKSIVFAMNQDESNSKSSKFRVPNKKPRNPHVEEMYDGTFRQRRENPKNDYKRKEKYRNYYDIDSEE